MKTQTQLNVDQLEEMLTGLSMPELRERFAACFEHTTDSRNRHHIVHRILWALQRDALGDISDAARQKALTIADDRDVKERFPKVSSSSKTNDNSSLTLSFKSKTELLPGTILHRKYQGADIHALVLENGFEWNGQHFKSLSATARAITGTRWNGKLFFGLKKGGAK